MKTFQRIVSIGLLMGLLCLAFAFPTFADGESDLRAALNGHGEVEAPADGLTVRFDITSYSNTVAKAQKETSLIMERVIAALAEYGVPMQDGYYTCEGFSGTRFAVTQCLTLTTERTDGAAAICNILHEQGVAAIREVSYFCKDTSAYEQEALRQAVADAQRMAEGLGITGSPVEIMDCGCYSCGYTSVGEGTSATVRVECNVQVRFGSGMPIPR